MLVLLHALLLHLILLCEARHDHYAQHRWPMAGIFGMSNNGDKKQADIQQTPPPPPPPPRAGGTSTPFLRPSTLGMGTPPLRNVQQQQQQQQSQPKRRPPPPPPPSTKAAQSKEDQPQETETKTAESADQESEVMEDPLRNQEDQEQWPGERTDGYVAQQQQQQQPPPSTGWMGSRQEDYGPPQPQWQNPPDMQPPPPSQFYNYQYPEQAQNADDSFSSYLQHELNDSLARESSLISQLDNLTSTVVVMEQREELHTRQLDVLTERVMDVEAQAAQDRNLMLEFEANCTALGNTVLGLQDDLEEWQQRCRDLQQRHDDDQQKLQELQKAIKAKQSEAEELAIAMEQLRMVEKRREANYYPASEKKGGGGLVSWVLSWFGLGGDNNERYDSDVREESNEMAKSSLLRALQTERANVHELEAAVASLQQNNSLISEMVESRDSIIDELNNRIAVFEEDKVVLKAALRQLQKEMSEEAPKTEKLLDDLAAAEQEINRLKADIHAIIQTHQEELTALQATISQKQKKITDAESNLTAIGTYVDKLEDRLTSFAITRRDMEEREKKCKEIEKSAEETEIQRKALQTQVEEYQGQQEELKKLLEELASERTNLQKENRKMYTEREFRIGEQEQLEAKYKALEIEKKNMETELQEWKDKCENILPELEMSQESRSELEHQLQNLREKQSLLEALQAENKDLVESYEKVKAHLDAAMEENAKLQSEMANMTKISPDEPEAETPDEMEKESEPIPSDKTSATGGRRPPPPPRRIAQPPPKSTERKVPLRSIRKKFAQATGMHGVITPSSKMTRKAAVVSGAKSGIPYSPPKGRSPMEDRPESSDDSEKALHLPPPPLP
jgi:hypothetical protein